VQPVWVITSVRNTQLFAGMLSHWGQKGPAEIEPKRAWTFRQVHWLAHRHGIEMQTPAQHPFNPLALLRLALACAPDGGTPSRHVCEQLMRHVWRGGADPNDSVRLADLQGRLAPVREPRSDAVKQTLKDTTASAVARGRVRRAHLRGRRPSVLGCGFAGHACRLPARRQLVRRAGVGRGGGGPAGRSSLGKMNRCGGAGFHVERHTPTRRFDEVVVAEARMHRAVDKLAKDLIVDALRRTDGFGRSDTRQKLRSFFEVDRHQIVMAALQALAEEGRVE